MIVQGLAASPPDSFLKFGALVEATNNICKEVKT